MGRRAVLIVVTALVVLLGTEVAARAMSSRLPEPQRWQNIEAQQKVAQMDRLSRDDGADVVFVGTSAVNVAIEPSIVQAGLGPGIDVYNAALSAGVPLIMEPWTVDVAMPRLRPKVVVLGVSSFDFYDHPSGIEFRKALADSPGGKEAMDTETIFDKADRAAQVSAMWEYRQSLRDPKTVARAVRGNQPAEIGEYGRVAPGGRTGAERYRPELRRSRQLGPPVGRWSLGEDSPAAIRRLITDVRAAGASVIVVDMPVNSSYVASHPNGEGDYAAYLDAARALTREMQVPFVEIPFGRTSELFYDQVHLLTESGNAFTQQLTARLLQEPAIERVRSSK